MMVPTFRDSGNKPEDLSFGKKKAQKIGQMRPNSGLNVSNEGSISIIN